MRLLLLLFEFLCVNVGVVVGGFVDGVAFVRGFGWADG